MTWPKATIVNILTVTTGSLLGLWLNQLFSENFQEILFQAVGLGTLLIGIRMALKLPDGYILIFIFSLIIGGLWGEWADLSSKITGLSDSLKIWLGNEDRQFSEGLITAFLLFCVGSMTIVGALEEGMNKNRELLYTKSILDGFSSIALTAAYGIGVWFSVIPMLIFQGGLTLLASALKKYFSPKVIDSLSALGGILIIGISIMLLKLGDIRLHNLLPALLVMHILAYAYEQPAIQALFKRKT
jgi:uncharacterized membrane protein YqgA involved in biofilm formation